MVTPHCRELTVTYANPRYAVRPGDVAIVATDGLFDNVELDEVCHIAAEWEQKVRFGLAPGSKLVEVKLTTI